MFRKFIAPFLIWLIYRTLSLTWRVQIFEPDSLKERIQQKKTFILAHWHGDELALIQFARRYRIATIVSTSKDGQLMDGVLKLLGAKTSRGSSTRGAVGALKGLIRLTRDGQSCSFAVDGPKGPIYKVKPGVFETSRMIKAPIFAGGVAVDRAWHFPRSWNKTYLPKPFAKIIVIWTEAMDEIHSELDPRSEVLAFDLEQKLNNTKEKALNLIAQV